MIKFNPENKINLTYGEALGPAMEIKDADEAQQYLADLIIWMQKQEYNLSDKTPEQAAKHNLGYYAGYYGDEVREQVERLFLCSHPIFGSIKENGPTIGTEAFEMGKNLAIRENKK